MSLKFHILPFFLATTFLLALPNCLMQPIIFFIETTGGYVLSLLATVRRAMLSGSSPMVSMLVATAWSLYLSGQLHQLFGN